MLDEQRILARSNARLGGGEDASPAATGERVTHLRQDTARVSYDSHATRRPSHGPDHGSHITSVLPIAARGLALKRNNRPLIDGIDLVVNGQGITMIMGPNGAGKSLLMKLLVGLQRPDRGTVHWNGQAPDRARAPRIGYVFQKPVLLRRSVLGNIMHALKAIGVRRAERRTLASQALARGHLEHLAAMPARLLSGGEQQRLALVRALAAHPQLLLLDEPTANLDPASTASIEALVLEAARAGTRVLFVSHDRGQVRRLADDVIFMHAGKIAERSSADAFFENPKSPLARHFLEGGLLVDETQKQILEGETTT
ncbi:ATP-binding cassette domain-containing protein [Breoghania sp.]|uniref:energy-coupling factor ABC transporter ATP-binding protein n=1 Tax=Breoghania sp. TaxID=2065378 RepID=UPI002AA75D85|nr:ATP-binding cassette domain-containing protein [Breoghania sp.]